MHLPERQPHGLARLWSLPPPLGLAIATCACLLPFAGKAFHIDDPLFIWVARRIQIQPFDFYGFEVNWYGRLQSMAEITKNPPGGAYPLALLGAFFGWDERVLHGGFLLFAVGAVLGTYRLGRELTPHPFLAAACALLTPVFLVCGTQVMCDMPMLCLWVWAVYFWVSGERAADGRRLWLAAALAAGAALTKYFGAALVPLLLVYSVVRSRRPTARLLPLALPVAALVAYQLYTARLYGRGLLLDAADYSAVVRTGGGALGSLLRGLLFTGGCLVSLLALAPWLCARRSLLVWGGGAVLAMIGLLAVGGLGTTVWRAGPDVKWGMLLPAVLFLVAGLALIALLVSELRAAVTAESILLALWILGTFLFAAYVNWCINGRSLLPLAPALGLLVARRLGKRPSGAVPGRGRITVALLGCATISLLPAWADYRFAGSARSAAQTVLSRPKGAQSTVWFEGHWGFQYYMEQGGGRALNPQAPSLRPGDLVVVPRKNTNVRPLRPEWFGPLEMLQLQSTRWMATMDPTIGAAFHTGVWGPLPFAFGRTSLEEYALLPVRVAVTPNGDGH